jgi:hypothetical protein
MKVWQIFGLAFLVVLLLVGAGGVMAQVSPIESPIIATPIPLCPRCQGVDLEKYCPDGRGLISTAIDNPDGSVSWCLACMSHPCKHPDYVPPVDPPIDVLEIAPTLQPAPLTWYDLQMKIITQKRNWPQ